MTIREQLQEKEWKDLVAIMNEFFVSQCNSWQADLFEFLTDETDDACWKARDKMIDMICEDVSETDLCENGWCEYSDETLIKMNIKAAEKFLEEHGFAVSRYEEDGKVVGIYFEDWTEGGVDMIHMLDGRRKDMTDEDWWKEEIIAIYENFSVDEEIDLHRQDKRYREAFSCSQSVHDFEQWDERLKEMAEACGY